MRTAPSTQPKLLTCAFRAPAWNRDPQPLQQLSDIRISTGSTADISGEELAIRALKTGEPKLGTWPPLIEYPLSPDSHILLPEGSRVPVAELLLWLKFETISEDFTVMLPEHPIAFSIENLLSGSQVAVREGDVPLVDSPTLIAGQFYINWSHQCYYCERVDGQLMTLVLLEDKQHGTLLTAVVKQDVSASRLYFPIEDGRLLTKLRSALSRYREA